MTPKNTVKPSHVEARFIKKWTQLDNLELISCWARDGCTDEEIAKRMGICRKTLHKYRQKSETLDTVIRSGKEIIDSKVESALLKAALGGKTTVTKVTKVKDKKAKDGNEKIIMEETTREYLPNVSACQFWLFNRQRDKWQRNTDSESVGQAINEDGLRELITALEGTVPDAPKKR
jgi:DNA-binding CsgD family transcriptional regulator